MKNTTIAWTTLMLLFAFSAISAAEHEAGNERTATFFGSSTTDHDLNEACADALGEDECLIRIPKGIISVTCDYSDDSFDPAGLYDGVGGVSFCEIPKGTVITLQYISTTSVAEALGSVTCPETTGAVWNAEIGTLRAENPVEIEVPIWCDEESASGHEGHTRVNIFNTAASISVAEGAAQIGLPTEGKIALSM